MLCKGRIPKKNMEIFTPIFLCNWILHIWKSNVTFKSSYNWFKIDVLRLLRPPTAIFRHVHSHLNYLQLKLMCKTRLGSHSRWFLNIFFKTRDPPFTWQLPLKMSIITRVAEVGSLSSGAKMAMKIFVKRVFTIFATIALFLRVIANLQI